MFSKLKNHAFSAGFHGSTSNSGSGSNPGSLHNLPGATSAAAVNIPTASSNLSNVTLQSQQQQQHHPQQTLPMQPSSVMSNVGVSSAPNINQLHYLSTGHLCYPPLIQATPGITISSGASIISSALQNQPRNGSLAPTYANVVQPYQNVGSTIPMPPPAQLTQSQPMANTSSLPNAITQHFEIGSLIGSAGPELAWRIYSAVRKCDRMPGNKIFKQSFKLILLMNTTY